MFQQLLTTCQGTLWILIRFVLFWVLLFFGHMLLFFENHIFRKSRSFIRSPGQPPRRKMTANGLSSYELSTPNLIFSAPARRFVSLLVKTHFFIFQQLLTTCQGTLWILKIFVFVGVLLFFVHMSCLFENLLKTWIPCASRLGIPGRSCLRRVIFLKNDVL